MILVIDTSSPSVATVATVPTIDGEATRELSTGRFDPELVKELVRSGTLAKVAVASGPGSFTGLRVGVSFGLGLAMGLRIPIVPLPTLDIQAARSDEPVTAVVDAGRGRYYFQVPGERPRLGEPAAIPGSHDLAGNVADRSSLVAAGHRFKPDDELRPFVEAAESLLRTTREVPYRNLEVEYMHSFLAKR